MWKLRAHNYDKCGRSELNQEVVVYIVVDFCHNCLNNTKIICFFLHTCGFTTVPWPQWKHENIAGQYGPEKCPWSHYSTRFTLNHQPPSQLDSSAKFLTQLGTMKRSQHMSHKHHYPFLCTRHRFAHNSAGCDLQWFHPHPPWANIICVIQLGPSGWKAWRWSQKDNIVYVN